MNKTYIFDIKPRPYHRMTRFSKWTDKALAYQDYLQKLRWLAKQQKFILSDTFSVIFVLPMPKSYSHKTRLEFVGKSHQIKPDLSNLLKAFEDALKLADQTIWKVTAEKRWGEKERIEVTNYGI